MLEQRKVERQKKEQKLFKSFLHSKLYDDKDKQEDKPDSSLPTTNNSNIPEKSIPIEVNKSNPKVFLDIKIGDEEGSRRIEFELFHDKVPKTVENFKSFCKGYTTTDKKVLTYKGTKFHKVIKDFMMQGGDFENGNGTGGCSIYGKKFDDENFVYPHSQDFLLSMANSGPNSNGSQFFITFKPAPWLNGKHVVFGRVIQGGEHVKAFEAVETGDYDVPKKEIVIVDCGEVNN